MMSSCAVAVSLSTADCARSESLTIANDSAGSRFDVVMRRANNS